MESCGNKRRCVFTGLETCAKTEPVFNRSAVLGICNGKSDVEIGNLIQIGKTAGVNAYSAK